MSTNFIYRFFLLFLILFMSTFLSKVHAQIFVQLEKSGTTKVTKFSIGDELTFRLKGDKKYWRTEAIEDIIPEESLIVFTNGMVKVGDIDALRDFSGNRWSNSVKYNLWIFGASWAVFSLLDAGVRNSSEFRRDAWAVPAASFVLGWVIRQIFKKKTYQLGKKRWLRLLDMTVLPQQSMP